MMINSPTMMNKIIESEYVHILSIFPLSAEEVKSAAKEEFGMRKGD